MRRIEDYALISNCRSAALAGRAGNIEWFCTPRFDSPACFANLLGDKKHGYWQIYPDMQVDKVTRRYIPETMVLESEFTTRTGTVQLIDFLKTGDEYPLNNLIRIVRVVDGSVPLCMVLVPRFDYGRSLPLICSGKDKDILAICGHDQLALHASIPCETKNAKITAAFKLSKGEEENFQLAWTPSHRKPGGKLDIKGALNETTDFWTGWLKSCHLNKRTHYPDMIIRSVLTLKALTYAPTGGIVAAATTSLPEDLEGIRNWDYRYCWLRDAALSLRAVISSTGQAEEIDAWRRWVLRACAGVPSQIEALYAVEGEKLIAERTLDWLPGFEESRPVRVGNEAHDQLQLDIYASVIEIFYAAEHMGLPRLDESWRLVREILVFLEEVWRRPDEGIWEVRGPRRHFVHSKAMIWAAFNCAIKAADELGIEGPVDVWRKMRALIFDEICLKGFDPALNSFTQYYGAKHVDANLLLLPMIGFLPADDPRIIGTVKAIEQELYLGDGLVLRYRPDRETEGLAESGNKGFILCSGWLGTVYAMQGRYDEAKEMLDHLVKLTNDVGLLAEQYDPKTRRQLGNFPQAFSHLTLIMLELALQKQTSQNF